MDEREATAALVSDLQWQIDQLKHRGITDKAGNPYNPSYYKRALKTAVIKGGPAVADFVRGYLYKPPSAAYKKLQEADALDLACEWLVADEAKPYAHLFTEEDRAAARKRLAVHIEAINDRKAKAQQRIDKHQAGLSGDVATLRGLAADSPTVEQAIAINSAILEQEADDPVALNRLGRAYEEAGRSEDAIAAFERAVAADPGNAIAKRRLEGLRRRG